MSNKLSVEENIKNTYLTPMSFLYEEPTNLLKQEVREPAIYTAIITATAPGYTRISEIASKVGLWGNRIESLFIYRTVKYRKMRASR